MAGGQIQAEAFVSDLAAVRRLLAGQFPQWCDLPLSPVASAGTDNAIYRLGDDMCLRLPRRPEAADQVEKECRWLPALAPLPLAVPKPLGQGAPAEGFPWPWAVFSWIEGETASLDRLDDPLEAAATLARFIAALQAVDVTGGPPSGPQNHFRGVPLAQMDRRTRRAIANLAGEIDVQAAGAVWEAALAAPRCAAAPVWVHGDIQPGNLLARDGRIAAVIDFGLLGVGDPACDLTVAWMLLPAEARPAFRAVLAVDDATWLRGCGWALYAGVIALDYYRDSNPLLSNMCRRAITEVLADFSA